MVTPDLNRIAQPILSDIARIKGSQELSASQASEFNAEESDIKQMLDLYQTNHFGMDPAFAGRYVSLLLKAKVRLGFFSVNGFVATRHTYRDELSQLLSHTA